MAVEKVAKLFEAGKLKIPGHPPPSPAPPDLLEAAPVKPQLTSMVWTSTQGQSGMERAIIPERIVNKWSHHELYGDDFSNLVKSIMDEFPEPSGVNAMPKKRKRDEDPGTPVAEDNQQPDDPDGSLPPKVPKLDQEFASKMVPTESITDSVLAHAPMGNVKAGKAETTVFVGHKCAIQNIGDKAVALNKGLLIAGFGGKGKWKPCTETVTADPDSEIVYELTGMDHEVLFNGATATISKLVEVKRQADPLKAKVCYYDMHDTPEAGRPGGFALVQKSKILYSIQRAGDGEREPDQTVKGVQSQMAGIIPVRLWRTKLSDITWIMKWNVNGLCPVRPVVVLTRDVEIPPQHTLFLD